MRGFINTPTEDFWDWTEIPPAPPPALFQPTKAFEQWGIYQHVGPNRSGKGMGLAIEAWKAYRRGVPVFANCTLNPYTEEKDHILRFPHYDYDPDQLFKMALEGVFVITDQAEQFMDSGAATTAVRNMGHFGYQAKKRSIAWHFDTVRSRNIYNRVRKNPDWIIYSKRIPPDWHKPLQAVQYELTTDERGDGSIQSRKILLVHPIERGFGNLYNSLAYVLKQEEE